MSVDVSSSDIIRLMLQFLRENNLNTTFQALQEETGISLNIIDDVAQFHADINDGRWDKVLNALQPLSIPQPKLRDLYEHIYLEMIEVKDKETARLLLRQTDVMQRIHDDDPDHYIRLESYLSRTTFDPKEAYKGTTKEKKRSWLSSLLATEVSSVPPHRLLTLLTQSLRYQESHALLPPDLTFDLLRGTSTSQGLNHRDTDLPTTTKYAHIKFAKKQRPECMVFSPDGESLVTGSVDGFIEVWNYQTGKLRMDLKYQENTMFMDQAVLCLAFNRDGKMMASGSLGGKINIWQIETGACLKVLECAHSEGITSLHFSPDASQIISTSFDHTIHIHGLKSGRTLKEFRGHSSFVNTAFLSSDGTRLVSGSSDGTTKIWDLKSQQCQLTVSPTHSSTSPTIHQLVPIPNSELFFVCDKSSTLYLMNMKGNVVKSFTPPSDPRWKPCDFVCCAQSPCGDYVECAMEDGKVVIFQVASGKMETHFQAHEVEVIAMTHHPKYNILATIGEDGQLNLWKP